jgi:hypothetical protein
MALAVIAPAGSGRTNLACLVKIIEAIRLMMKINIL